MQVGQPLLVMGRSGCGKSSLLRVLGGLWKPTGGTVCRPSVVGTGGYIFLPQRTFTTEGTLVEQVIFPAVAGKRDGGAARRGAVPHHTVVELLDYVGLGSIVAKYGVDSPQPWDSRLSLGELQRLGFARVFFHQPKFVIMDEATSSIDLDFEKAIMRRIIDMGITCVTVAHRPSMIQYHTQLLRFDGNGGFEPISSLPPPGARAG